MAYIIHRIGNIFFKFGLPYFYFSVRLEFLIADSVFVHRGSPTYNIYINAGRAIAEFYFLDDSFRAFVALYCCNLFAGNEVVKAAGYGDFAVLCNGSISSMS